MRTMYGVLAMVVLVFESGYGVGRPLRTDKPNVVIILSDDQGYGDLGFHGNEVIATPVLDKFAMESARFDRFYVSPLCAPTRASLLTGRYHLRTGTVSVSKGMEIMQSSEVTLAEVFKANGYTTGIFGKWHNGQHMPNHPLGQGFDEFFGFCGGHWSNYFDTRLEHNGKKVDTRGYITDILTDKAIEFIDANRDTPFLCYIPYNAPHSPHQVPDVYFNKYKAKGLDNELASIYGMVENMDVNIGRLLKKLDTSGIADETIVLFLTDNGPNGVRYNGGMKGIKGSVDEGGVRVPCFWRWKGKIPPGNITLPGAHIDILPTLTELCDLKNVQTNSLDGVSLASALEGTDQQLNRNLFTHFALPQLPIVPYPGAVRSCPYTLIIAKNSTRLYDIGKDPTQKNDIAADNAALVQRLTQEYNQWFNVVSKGIKPATVIPLSPLSDVIELPAVEASFRGNLRFMEGHGWVHDWLVNWTSTTDSIYWDLDSSAEQPFDVYLNYTCSKDDVGSDIKVSAGSQNFTFRISETYAPPFIPSPDRVKRKEAYEKTWKRVKAGVLLIAAGRTTLVLTAPRIAGKQVGEINSVELVRR